MNGESYRAAGVPAFPAVQFPSREQVKMEGKEKNYSKLKKGEKYVFTVGMFRVMC